MHQFYFSRVLNLTEHSAQLKALPLLNQVAEKSTSELPVFSANYVYPM
jgi:hypothetical protein